MRKLLYLLLSIMYIMGNVDAMQYKGGDEDRPTVKKSNENKKYRD